MKKKWIVSIALACIVAVSTFAAGCNGKQEEVQVEQVKITEDTLALPHYNGIVTKSADGEISGDGSYDSDLLYYAGKHVWGADQHVIWVPEERSEEYGGYFYMYLSGTGGGVNDKGQNTNVLPDGSNMMVQCYRSKDLNDWEMCGAIEGGWCLYLEPDTWVYSALWASEVIYNPDDGKYYLYFTARTRINDGSIEGATYQNFEELGSNTFARLSVGIACSDTPVGPFKMVSSERNYNGGANPNGEILSHVNPTFNIPSETKFPFIDCHPVFIDDGNPDTFDLYLFIAKHIENGLGIYGNNIWGMKMKDMATPDFNTLRYLLGYGKTQTITYNGTGAAWDEASYTKTYFGGTEKEQELEDRGSIVEAPTLMMREVNGKTKYYLLSSPYGVGSVGYDVDVAVADSPLGPYKMLPRSKRLLTGDAQNDFMSSLGHCGIVSAEGQTYCVFGTAYAHGIAGSAAGGRFQAFAPVAWYYDEDEGFELPVVNGPLQSLQPRPMVASGYSNVVDRAIIGTKNVNTDTLKYLTDGLVPTQSRLSKMETTTTKTSATITFAFEEPVTLRGVCVYNSYTYSNAFKQIDSIVFELAEEKVIGKESSKSVAIQNLPFDQSYYNVESSIMRPGGASIATFGEIKVKKVTISIATPLDASASTLSIGEIMLLGK